MNTNPDFKHKNTCLDFLAFSCIFLSTKQKHKSISSKNTNTNLAVDFLKPHNPGMQNLNSNPNFIIFQSTTKPLANKIKKTQKIQHKNTIKKKKIINSNAPILKPKQNYFSVLFRSLFDCQENERIKIWIAPSKSIQSPYSFVSMVSLGSGTQISHRQKHEHLNYKKISQWKNPQQAQRVNKSQIFFPLSSISLSVAASSYQITKTPLTLIPLESSKLGILLRRVDSSRSTISTAIWRSRSKRYDSLS